MKKFLAVLFILVFAMGIAGTAVAVSHPTTTGGLSDLASKEPDANIRDLPALVAKIDNVTNLIFVLLLAASVIFIIIAAFQFVTAGGKPESISEARQKIIFAVVGIAIAVFAKSIPFVITSFLNGT